MSTRPWEGEFTEGHELPGKWGRERKRWGGDGYRRRKRRGCWRSSSKGSGYEEFIGAKKHLVLGVVWCPIVDNPRDQTQYTLDDRYNDGNDHQAMVLLCRRE